MNDKDFILQKIKKSIHAIEPDATVILYGSYARGTFTADSDIDVLILLEKDSVTRFDEKKIKYPLYEIEFETGTIISPLVLTRKDWENKHRITPFYENVVAEGQII